MKKVWLLAVSLLLVLVVISLAGCTGTTSSGEIRQQTLSNQQEGIWVTGQGKVMATPDIVSLRLGIEAQRSSVAAAQEQAAQAMDQVMAALTENGVAKKDIQTQRFSIQKVTKWDKLKEEEVVIGYKVTNMVTAKIRDIDKAGSIIDAVARAGGDFTRIDSLNFTIDDPLAYYEEAREKAMADAKNKAGRLAELAGITLGKPVYISEGIELPPTPVYQRALAYEAAAVPITPISPGEMEIRLSVQIVYAIK